MNRVGITLSGLIKKYNVNIVLEVPEKSFDTGYIYGLIGTNGSGKTTLLEIINGSVIADEGEVNLHDLKTEMVYHENGLFQDLKVYENIFVGRELKKSMLGVSWLDWKGMLRASESLLAKHNLDIPIKATIKDLPLSVQKLLEVIIALSKEPDLLIIDEPLTYFDISQITFLNRAIKQYVDQGNMAIYSSHRWGEIYQVVDRIVTMRDGHIVSDEVATPEVLRGFLEFSERDNHKYTKRTIPLWPGLLQVKELRTKHIGKIDFSLHKGEILGIVGLKNAYKSEIGKALFGAIHYEGHIILEGSEKRIRTTANAVEEGICYIGIGDEGVFVEDSVINNVISANVPRIRKLRRSAKQLISKYYLDMLNVSSDQMNGSINQLSAGYKQKVLLAKWFFSKSKIFIFNKPTANLDAASKVDIYNVFADLAESGAGIIIVSNDLEEVAGLCDRVLIVESGGIKKVIDRKDLTVYSMVEAMQNW
ncbi:MAG: ATP-binding cassette domain-containing protein [Vallitaleaceae bacterium]|jgi:ribose transport system ATP-binding protein|nr:ATP-binding cassette domain-containing protein [Vallitaleaceae bacterium]